MIKAKILLLSGYDAPSHQYWRETISTNLSEYEWTQVVLAPRHYSWRIRGNAFNFYSEHLEKLNKNYDLIIATSMVDINNLCGLVPSLANIPKILYFHENQFAYPLASGDSKEKQNAINAQITSIFSAICAKRILFNSEFNFNSFFEGGFKLSKMLPDGISTKVIERLKDKSHVLPVPICTKCYIPEIKFDNAEPVKILWNHRWEFDKQPEVFIDAMKRLKKGGIKFRLFILGQSFRNKPKCLDNVNESLKNEVSVIGFQSREEYDRIMKSSDLVVSSALHDFQGLSMLEAISNGCIPIAPARVAYPEYISKRFLYDIQENDNQENRQKIEAKHLVNKVCEVIHSDDFSKSRLKLIKKCQSMVKPFTIHSLIERYNHEIQMAIKKN